MKMPHQLGNNLLFVNLEYLLLRISLKTINVNLLVALEEWKEKFFKLQVFQPG